MQNQFRVVVHIRRALRPVLALVIGATLQPQAVCAELTDELWGNWTFDSGFADSSGNGRDLIGPLAIDTDSPKAGAGSVRLSGEDQAYWVTAVKAARRAGRLTWRRARRRHTARPPTPTQRRNAAKGAVDVKKVLSTIRRELGKEPWPSRRRTADSSWGGGRGLITQEAGRTLGLKGVGYVARQLSGCTASCDVTTLLGHLPTISRQ